MRLSHVPASLSTALNSLASWAISSRAEADLERVFGPSLDWTRAYRFLHALATGDLGALPPTLSLSPACMPGLWGGYSRETRSVYLSSDCPVDLVDSVWLEEIGHFLDHELCATETPGDEGALFAALVLGLTPTACQASAWAREESIGHIHLGSSRLPVEAASQKTRRSKGKKNGKSKRKSNFDWNNPFIETSGSSGSTGGGSQGAFVFSSNSSDVRLLENGTVIAPSGQGAYLVQSVSGAKLIGSAGNDTYEVFSEDVRIEDKHPFDNDTVISSANFSIAKFPGIIKNLFLSGSSGISGVGNDQSNSIQGNGGSNLLEGALGNDTLDGGSGDDTLNGGGGADLLVSGGGDDLLSGGLDSAQDTLVGGSGNDSYFVEDTRDVILEALGGGTDTIFTSNRDITLLTFANIENIVYTGGGSALISSLGTENDDLLFGASSNDSLLGKGGNDTLDGKGGDDYLDGGTGNDSMIGGAGNDTYFVDSALDMVLEAANVGTDLIVSSVSQALGDHVEHLTLNDSLAVADANINGTGNSLANTLTGNGGNNQLDGATGADTLRGGAGNDILNGGTADGEGDLLEGGEGNDRYIVDSTLDVLRDSGGTDTVETSVSFNIGDTFRVEGIEHLLYTGLIKSILVGNAGDNSLTLSQEMLLNDDTLVGGAGDDTLSAGLGTNSLVGGDGDDYYVINSNTDIVVEENSTLGGIDTVISKVSNFSLGGESNSEYLSYDGISKATLAGSNANNFISGGKYGNLIYALDGNDSITGSALVDTIYGGAGDDTLDGKGGSDVLRGGSGNDIYFAYSQAQDIVDDGDNSTSKDIVYSSQTFSLQYSNKLSNIESLQLTGNSNATGTGNSLANSLLGNDGKNALSGKTGNDTIFGGLGSDTIVGDEGDDFIAGGGSPQGDLNADRTTPVTIGIGQSFTGTFDKIGDGILLTNFDADWIRADLKAGGKYEFVLDVTPSGIPVATKITTYQLGNPRGPVDLGLDALYTFSNKFRTLTITAFSDTEVYVPVYSSGPGLGTYKLTLNGPGVPLATDQILADDSSNILIGGLGRDTLISGNGRNKDRNPIGDLLLGGTNGILGRVDTDHSGDTLIGGDGSDTLDGGAEGVSYNSLVGGNGNDYYYLRSANDKVLESADQGDADAMYVGFSTTTGAQWDIDLAPNGNYANIELVTLTGASAISVLGNENNNQIVGNFGDNTFDGGVGDDSLQGEGGNDSLLGGEGADYLDGGSGINTLEGGFGADAYIVNDRNDRIVNEQAGLDGGEDLVRTYFNFDPILGSPVSAFDAGIPDNSPSITKVPSFASSDLDSFYNLEHFELLGNAVYGVGNALNNSITAGPASALLLGMGGEDTIIGGAGDDTLHGDTPDFYASPDLYAAAPTDTRTQEFVNGVIGAFASDYLTGGEGDDYLNGGRSFDTMVGGNGDNIFVQDHIDDYVVAIGDGANELITSVDIAQAPDGINDLMLVVRDQDRDASRQSITGQEQVASFASFLGSEGGSKGTYNYTINNLSATVTDASHLEVMYSHNVGDTYRSTPSEIYHKSLSVGFQFVDPNDNTKVAYALSWTAQQYDASGVIGYTVRFKRTDLPNSIWKTYLDGTAQDLRGTQVAPSLVVDNLDPGVYEFEVVSNRLAIPVERDFSDPGSLTFGSAIREQVVTLQGGGANDFISAQKLVNSLPGGLLDDTYTDPLVFNNLLDPLPLGFLFAPEPLVPSFDRQSAFAAYLDGGAGNDLLVSARVNEGLGEDYLFQGVVLSGLNTMVGGQGSDTFVVKNGGQALGDEFDWIVKYGNETPVNYGAGGVGASLNGGQHNLVISAVPHLVLSDTIVSQGKFIDQLGLSGSGQFGMGNRLDNYIYDGGRAAFNTLVGNTGRDSLVSSGQNNVLIGGTAYGVDNVGLAIKDFASISDGGNGLTNSIFRDTDPIPVDLNGPGTADPSQFWFMPGYYGSVFDPARNRDTLVANNYSTLDGGAGNDSLVGSNSGNDKGDNFLVSAGYGGMFSQDITKGDAVFGNGGNDTVTYTDSDYLWWQGHEEGKTLISNVYTIAGDISNLVLQMGAPTARNGTGNKSSEGNDHSGWFEELGSNLVLGNEFDNMLNGGGVGGDDNVGGFDTLTGGGGRDFFFLKGYTGASNNNWKPSITDYTEGPLAGQSEWDAAKSEYTDADFVLVTDFTPGQDFIFLPGAADSYWIGAAPSRYQTDNVRPLTGSQTPGANSFGIYQSAGYNSGTPDLVAHIQVSGAVGLDVNALTLAYQPTEPGTPIPTGNKASALLGWGKFYEFDSAVFSDGSALTASLQSERVFGTITQSRSTASLSALMGQIV